MINRLKTACTAMGALVVTLLASEAALAAHPTPGAHYSGRTSQRQGIAFDVSSNGRRLIHPAVYLLTACSTGAFSYAGSTAHNAATASARISKRGGFSLHFRERGKTDTGVAHARFTVNGRFVTATRVTGTAAVTVRYPHGQSCVSGHVHFSATA